MNIDTIMPILQTSFLLNIKSGYSIIDSILSIIILLYAKKILEFLPEILKWIKKFISRKGMIKSEYLIQGTITISTEFCSHCTNFPQDYKAIMYKISKLSIDITHGKHFNSNGKYNCDDTKENDLFSYSVNTEKEIEITKDIFVRQSNKIDKSNDLKCSIEFFNLYVYSYTLTFMELKKIINEWVSEYRQYIKEYNDGNIYYFSYIGNIEPEKSPKDVTKFESHKFYSNKSFDNIFFKNKAALVRRLNYFINNENEYKKMGIPHTFGLLFYGYPGCGKTSTIKAIANYTKRHIIEIPLSKIKTCQELKNIFFNEIINDRYVPANKKIIVLEDIDCMGDLVKKRSHKDKNAKKSNLKLDHNLDKEGSSLIANNIEDNDFVNIDYMNSFNKEQENIYNKLIKTLDNANDKLTLSYILNLIDGVLEQKGRILIITTNHPEKIDDALLRPGRIDLKIHFNKCDKIICKEILDFYFGIKLDMNLIDHIPDNKFTPAEIFQLCLNLNNLDIVLKNITNKTN